MSADGSPQVADLLKRVLQAAGRMNRMVSDVLAFSEAGRRGHVCEPIDLDRLLANTVEEDPQPHEPNASVRVDSSLGLVLGDRASLTQCFTNLLRNAVKYVETEKKPEIHVFAEPHGERVRINIQDNGIGIPAEDVGKIFKAFQRLHSANQYEGTGLGLAITKRAVERMGGRVGVQSTPGKGSCFWLELKRPLP